jgi:hypothetical protein
MQYHTERKIDSQTTNGRQNTAQKTNDWTSWNVVLHVLSIATYDYLLDILKLFLVHQGHKQSLVEF